MTLGFQVGAREGGAGEGNRTPLSAWESDRSRPLTVLTWTPDIPPVTVTNLSTPGLMARQWPESGLSRVSVWLSAFRGAANNADYRDIVRMSLILDGRNMALLMPVRYRFASGQREYATLAYDRTRNQLDAIYASQRLKLLSTGLAHWVLKDCFLISQAYAPPTRFGWVLELLLPSVRFRHRLLAVAAIVSQLVIQPGLG